MTATVETNKGIAVAAFRPITWSIKDTKQTITEIKIHNEVGTKLGFWTAPPDKAVRGWARIKSKIKHWPIKKTNAVVPAPMPAPAATIAAPVPAASAVPSEAENKPATKPTLLKRIRVKLHRKPKPLP